MSVFFELEIFDLIVFTSIAILYALFSLIITRIIYTAILYPLEYKKVFLFLKWQGIIAKKNPVVIQYFVEAIAYKLYKENKLFNSQKSPQAIKDLEPFLLSITEEIAKEISDELHPQLWDRMPRKMKKEIVLNSQTQTLSSVKNILSNIHSRLYQELNIKELINKSLTKQNRLLLYNVFHSIIQRDYFRVQWLIVAFGFFLGLIIAVLYSIFPQSLNFTIASFLISLMSAFMSLRSFFRPSKKLTMGRVTFQGIFLKNKKFMAHQFARILSKKILTPKRYLNQMLQGETSEAIFGILKKSVAKAVDDTAVYAKPILSLAMSSGKYEEMKSYIVSKITNLLPTSASKLEEYIETTMDVKTTLKEEIENMNPREFEKILKNIFGKMELHFMAFAALVGACLGFVMDTLAR